MKLLLDENLPKKLKYRFSENFEVLTVPEMGWSGIKNGDLLKQMHSKGLKVLLTLDKNFSYQQNIEKYSITLIVLNGIDARYNSLVSLIPKAESFLDIDIKPGVVIIE
ncbi:DUF5615 family PIN-like protein [Polaribacter sp. Hel_I_88]|uniref:DUF5615 family PIN-like protein n=1 Tax=Polaribacter sp. Hel_I_88 TaxID=1250006 RepID=UPI00047CA2E4|nr:DUF5615 family PIN-like protein [Polaribacter sp. Hel_I_88]